MTMTDAELAAHLARTAGRILIEVRESGLFAGKQVGIFGAMWIADKIGFAKPPAGASALQLWGVATLCGIGFTMSLFIGALAFPRDPLLVEEAKLGVLFGSLLSAVLGYAILRFAKSPEPEADDDPGKQPASA